MIAVFLAAAILTMLWGMRVALGPGQGLAARTILAPLMTMFLFFGVAGLVGVAYLTRARFPRIVGALAGGAGAAAVRMLGLKVDISMGWWQSRFADVPNPLSLVSEPALFLMYAAGTAMVFLISWRIIRRFGWAGQAIAFIAVAAGAPFRERIWFDRFMQVMFVPLAALPWIADAIIFGAALMLGYALMRLIAGPATSDGLARTR